MVGLCFFILSFFSIIYIEHLTLNTEFIVHICRHLE